MYPALARAAEREAAWQQYAQAVYRHGCIAVVTSELERTTIQPRVKSAKLAWLSRRIQHLVPIDCGNAIRCELDFYRSDLDSLHSQWDRMMSNKMGETISSTINSGLNSVERMRKMFWTQAVRYFSDNCNSPVRQSLHMPYITEPFGLWFFIMTTQAYCLDCWSQKAGFITFGLQSCQYPCQAPRVLQQPTWPRDKDGFEKQSQGNDGAMFFTMEFRQTTTPIKTEELLPETPHSLGLTTEVA